jgi:ribose 5-phosphate isomerase B
MFVYIASDHAGYKLKEEIKKFVNVKYPDFEVADFGASSYDETDDYPDFVFPAMSALQEKLFEGGVAYGIVLGGSGTGEAIVANRFERVRAVVCNSENLEIVTLARQHNDANVISFGARFVSEDFACSALRCFFETSFEGFQRARLGRSPVN